METCVGNWLVGETGSWVGCGAWPCCVAGTWPCGWLAPSEEERGAWPCCVAHGHDCVLCGTWPCGWLALHNHLAPHPTPSTTLIHPFIALSLRAHTPSARLTHPSSALPVWVRQFVPHRGHRLVAPRVSTEGSKGSSHTGHPSSTVCHCCCRRRSSSIWPYALMMHQMSPSRPLQPEDSLGPLPPEDSLGALPPDDCCCCCGPLPPEDSGALPTEDGALPPEDCCCNCCHSCAHRCRPRLISRSCHGSHSCNCAHCPPCHTINEK